MLIRRSSDRGYFDHGWLKTYHSFSFGEYYDKSFMNFHDLRVINEDFINPNSGFGFHPHRDMEIITYIISGELTHEDNLGNKEKITAGCFQVMSAGSGIIHSEFNHSSKECHLLQIWISPDRKSHQKTNQFSEEDNFDPYYKILDSNHYEKFLLVASGDGRENSIKIRQDAKIYAINSGELSNIQLPKSTKDNLYIHIAEGEIGFGDLILKSGDGVGISSFKVYSLEFLKPTKLLLFLMN